MASPAVRPAKARLLLFISGDFAFNLYWQSVMLYLLFYYTEAINLPMATAAACYATASVWDGLASLAVGLLVDRYTRPTAYRIALIAGSVPLGLSFLFAYLPPPVAGDGAVIWVMAGHMLFRTLYALVNIPYLAMSARVSMDQSDRTLVAGGRMLAGTLAGVLVAVGTLPIGEWLFGARGAHAYAGAAMLFAGVASLLLIAVGVTYRDAAPPAVADRVPVARAVVNVWTNPAFLVLSAAMMAMIIAVTVLDKSVLYYFKYRLEDQAAGQQALGWMMAIGGVAVPLWLAISWATGVRSVWFIAVMTGAAALVLFVLFDLQAILSVDVFLVTMQVAIVGLNFAVWALLPDVVDHGERRTGIRTEAALYGFVAFIQRVAIGLGTAILGLSLTGGGKGDGDASGLATGEPLRLTLALIPLFFLLLSAAVMLVDPLRKRRSAV